jgi:hypothetical protein
VGDFSDELEKVVIVFAAGFVLSCELPVAEKHLHVIEENQTAVLAQVVEELGEWGFAAAGGVFVGEDFQQVGEGCVWGWGEAEAAIDDIVKVGFDLLGEADGERGFANSADSQKCDQATAIFCYPLLEGGEFRGSSVKGEGFGGVA